MAVAKKPGLASDPDYDADGSVTAGRIIAMQKAAAADIEIFHDAQAAMPFVVPPSPPAESRTAED